MLDSEKRARIIAKDFLPSVRGKALFAFLENLLRIGPGARRMRIVGAEHDLVEIEHAADHFDSERIIDEADPNLPVKVFTGQHFWQCDRAVAREPASVSRALIPDIQAL